jgi:hypothetical protein
MYRPAAADATLILVHIPKTAGTTLAIILLDWFGKDAGRAVSGWHEGRAAFSAEPVESRVSPRVVYGHQAFGLHEHIPKPCEYLTFLRDPVARVISHYYHVRSESTHYLHRRVTRLDMPIEEYVENPFRTAELDNAQVRMLASPSLERYQAVGEAKRSLLESAKDNLEQAFCFVGLTERFDESMVAMSDLLGWNRVPTYLPARVSSNKSRGDISERVRSRVREVNHLDVELYEHVRQRFDAHIRSMGESLRDRVRCVRDENRRVAAILAAQAVEAGGAAAETASVPEPMPNAEPT